MAIDRAARAPRGLRCALAASRFCAFIRRFVGGLLLAMTVFATLARATNFAVNSVADDGSPGTLRWAIEQVNVAGSGSHTISFSLPNGATISLTRSLPILDNSGATIAIDGPGAGNLTIDGHNSHRVFFIATGNVEISDLTIANGAAQGGNGGIGNGGGGGGLGAGGALFVNDGADVRIADLQLSGNSATGGQGGSTMKFASGGGGGGLGGDGGEALYGGGGGGGFQGDGGVGQLGGGGGGGLFGDGGAGIGGGGGGGGITDGDPATTDGGDGNAGATGGTAGTESSTSAPAGDGGAGQSPALQGAGGGGMGGRNTWTGSPGAGGAGGNGGLFGGGAGGGAGGTSLGTVRGAGGVGGDGGLYGGGGGAGHGDGGDPRGGAGGDFGGGGGGANFGTSSGTGRGGPGGFGGGGGGASEISVFGGAAGFGGGEGGHTESGGSGGSAYGGAIFVRQGGSLTIVGTTVSGSSVTAGERGGPASSNGAAAGQDLYLMPGVTATFDNAGSSMTGSISGAGGVHIQGSGTTQFSGANTYTGGTTVSGTSRLQGTTASLQGDITNNSNVTFNQSTNGTYAGVLSGSGAVYAIGTGSVTFSGHNTYHGPTYVQAGRLVVNGSLASDVTVDPGAVLGGTGTINAQVANNGTLAAGNSIGALVINGAYSDSAGSTTEVEINAWGTTPGTNNDLIRVNGSATLNGGTVNVVAARGNYVAGSRYTFLQAQALAGSYSTVTGFTSSRLRVELGYGDEWIGGVNYHTAFLEFIPTQSDFASIAQTFNQYGVANYIDAASAIPNSGIEPVIDSLDLLTAPQQRAALDSMTAQVNGTLAQLNVQDTTFLYMMLRRRVGSAFAAGGMASGGTSAGFAPGAGATFTPVGLSKSRSVDDWIKPCGASRSCPSWAGWSVGYGLGGNATPDGNAAGGVYGSGGTIVALERPLDDESLIGMFGAYSNLAVRLDGVSQRADANQGQFGAYFLRDLERHYFLGAGSFGFASYTETRRMAFGDINSTASGDYSGWNPSAYLEHGSRWQVGRTMFQPYGALQYIYVRQNSFTETGAGVLDQYVGGIDTHALRGLLGARLAQAMTTKAGRDIVPEIRAAWMHEFLEPSSTLNATFAPIGGGSFAARGLNFGRDWALLGAGAQFALRENVSLFANYDLLFNSRQTWNAGSGGVQFVW